MYLVNYWIYENSLNFKSKERDLIGKGVYLAPDIMEAGKYASKIKLGERKTIFQLMIMCRVKPDKIRDPGVKPINWVVDGDYDCLRPYRILVKEI